MITIDDQFVIRKPLAEVWAFFDDFEGLATCVPTLQEFAITADNRIEGKVGVTLGAIPITSKIRLEITEKRPLECIQAHGLSYLGETIATQLSKDADKYQITDTGQIYLHLDVRSEDAESTRIMFCAGVEAEGKLRKMYESIMRLKVPAMKVEFMDKVGKALQAECTMVGDTGVMCLHIDEVKEHVASRNLAAESTAPVKENIGLWARFTQWLRSLVMTGNSVKEG
jgi:carbon monoxide dehydrogenase subunit G